jgi:hypothetical protein
VYLIEGNLHLKKEESLGKAQAHTEHIDHFLPTAVNAPFWDYKPGEFLLERMDIFTCHLKITPCHRSSMPLFVHPL